MQIADVTIKTGTISPAAPKETDTLVVTLEVANIGLIPVTDVVISVFFGICGTAFALPDEMLPRVTLAPRETTTVQVSWKIPPAWGNKDVDIWAEVDVTGKVAERNEANNRFDLGKLRIVPCAPLTNQAKELMVQRFRNQTYQYFDIRQKDKSAITNELSRATEVL